MSLIHFAGVDVQIGALLRQRCSWCGSVLGDHDLNRVAVPEGQDPRPATWPIGSLVEVDGPASWTVDHADGDSIPRSTCAEPDLIASTPAGQDGGDRG